MRYTICAALALAAGSAFAQLAVYEGDGMKVILTKQPCQYAALSDALSEVVPQQPMAAMIVIQGADVPACWTHDDEKVYIGDVFGNAGYIPKEAFKAAKSV